MSFSHPSQGDKPAESSVPEASAKGSARALALRLLLGRPLSAHQLYQKLRDKDFPHDAAEAACAAMRAYGYLDDAKLAEMICASASRQGKGPGWIRQQLSRRKVSQPLIDAAAKVPRDEALAQATALVTRRFAQSNAICEAKGQARALRFLAARGFGAETAYAAVRAGVKAAQQAQDTDPQMC